MAEQFLTKETAAEVAELLHGETLDSVASFADDYRSKHPETARWHFVDMPRDAEKFDRDRDCPVMASDPKGPWRDCVTDRILYFEQRLGDRTLSEPDRAFALKFLVHLIGDIQQPFHTLAEGRGGNNNKVTLLGSQQCGTRACNLHAVWDDSLIEDRGLNDRKYLAMLLDEIKMNHWERFSGGEPVAWANASHHYAVLGEAPNGALLMKDYVQEEGKIVDAQLALGGLRLATVLNRILGQGNDAPGRKALPPPR